MAETRLFHFHFVSSDKHDSKLEQSIAMIPFPPTFPFLSFSQLPLCFKKTFVEQSLKGEAYYE